MVKTINQRPTIIANVSKQTWQVVFNKETKQFDLFQPGSDKVVKVKEETKTTGKFEVNPNDNRYTVILPDGTVARYYECKRYGKDTEFNSLKEALNILEKTNRLTAYITRTKTTYYNPVTKQTTSDKAAALAWFPKKSPLIISPFSYQRIGMWIDPGKDYVDISLYFVNHLSRTECKPWTKASDTGFRLYNDGTVSHFWSGVFGDTNRTFVKERVTNHKLDPRSRSIFRALSNLIDLRSTEVIGCDSDTRYLCQETFDILKKAGFPDYLWCWGNCKRKFTDTYDLINFAKFAQKHPQTKKGALINEFLKDKPFTPNCNLVEPFNDGVIIRVPGFCEEWQDTKGQFYHFKPYSERAGDFKLLSALCYERYRVWLSNDGTQRTCQELVHNGEEWKRVRWDSIAFESHPTIDKPEECDTISKGDQQKYSKALKAYNEILQSNVSNIFVSLPCLQHLQEFAEDYPHLSTLRNIKEVITAMHEAPKLTETLFKIGHGNWFFDMSRGYYSRDNTTFLLSNVLYKFGVTDYHEDKRKTLYQNLGVSKEQFEWLGSYRFAGPFMEHFNHLRIPVPGKTNEFYQSFAAVPLKYIQILAKCCEVWGRQSGIDHYGAWDVSYFVNYYGYTPLDIQKAMDKNLNVRDLRDYLRMRNEMTGVRGFNLEDWSKVPEDNTDLTFCHNRLIEFYNFHLAERDRYYRAQEEKRLLGFQENYAKRYKTLKSLAYQNETDTRCIIVPEKLIELTIEGQVLHHCVGSFAESVSAGRDTIVFLRHKDKPAVPYATISLLKNGEEWYIDQAHTKSNGPITEEDVEFLKDWAKDHNIDTSSIRTNYRWNCHH